MFNINRSSDNVNLIRIYLSEILEKPKANPHNQDYQFISLQNKRQTSKVTDLIWQLSVMCAAKELYDQDKLSLSQREYQLVCITRQKIHKKICGSAKYFSY